MTTQEIHDKILEKELCTVRPIIVQDMKIIKPQIDKDTLEFINRIKQQIIDAWGIPAHILKEENENHANF